jgi:hypothetical protein
MNLALALRAALGARPAAEWFWENLFLYYRSFAPESVENKGTAFYEADRP